MKLTSSQKVVLALSAILVATAMIASSLDWSKSNLQPPSPSPLSVLPLSSASSSGTTTEGVHREQAHPESLELEKSSAKAPEAEDTSPPAGTSAPDPRPHAYSISHILTFVKADRWLNPENIAFTRAEEQKIEEFVRADGSACASMAGEFQFKLNELGNQLISQGRYDGRVNERDLTEEELDKLPYLTEDWLNPIFVVWSGGFRTWIQIDLRKEDPRLADLKLSATAEQAAARARLRDFIAELARKR